MHPETPQPEPSESADPKEEKKELTGEQKKALAEIWTEVAIDNAATPARIEEMTVEEIRKWLFESLMIDVDVLADEWGLSLDRGLIEKIQKAKPGAEREKLEIDYFLAAHAKIDERVESFSRSPEKSTKWDSWPKKMRETGEFNCVGATLLGIRVLDAAGIENYFGNPYGHDVNIVKTSVGNWFYVDFRNGKRNVFNLEPEVAKIKEVTVLKVKSTRTDYRLIPIYGVSDIASSIIANLSSMTREAGDPSVPDQSAAKKDAKETVARYEAVLKRDELHDLDESLFPGIIHFDATPETQEEERRIKSHRNFEDEIAAYVVALPKETEELINKELKAKKKELVAFVSNGDRTIFETASVEFKKFLNILSSALERLKNEPPEIRDEIIASIVGRINS
jgi:hypothetical protein